MSICGCVVHKKCFFLCLKGIYLFRSFSFLFLFKKKNLSILLSLCSLACWGVILLSARLYWMGNKPPNFSNSDNPAADSPDFLTRTLTFFYLPAANAWLLLCPDKLSFDWSMDAVPLVRYLADWRNLHTVAFYCGLILLALSSLRGSGFATRETNWKAHITNGKSVTNGNGYHVPDTNQNTDLGLPRPTLNGCAVPYHCYSQTSLPPTESLVVFSLSILALPFIPATNLFFYVGFVIAERVLYIPSIGYCILVATGARTLYVRLRTRACKFIMLSLCIGLVLLNGLKTVQRNKDWSNEENLYKSGIQVNPAKGKKIISYHEDISLVCSINLAEVPYKVSVCPFHHCSITITILFELYLVVEPNFKGEAKCTFFVFLSLECSCHQPP